MTTTLSEGVKVPDVGSVNWAGDLEINWNLLNGALANLSFNVKLDRDNTWTGEQTFSLPIVGSITGTASKAIADEDGTSIKTGYVNVAGPQTVTGQKTWTGEQTFSQTIQGNAATASAFDTAKSITLTGAVTGTVSGTNSWEITTALKTGSAATGGTVTNPYFKIASWEVAPNDYFGTILQIQNKFYPYQIATLTIGLRTKTDATFQRGYSLLNNAIGIQSSAFILCYKEVTGKVLCELYYYITTSFNGIRFSVISEGTRNDSSVFNTMVVYQNPAGIAALPSDYTAIQTTIGTYTQDFIPYSTNTYSLGSSSYQWSSVYAQTYYYNGTEFQSKFVTTDTEQTITKTKTFNIDNNQVPDIYHNTSSGFSRYRTRGSSNLRNYDSYLRWSYTSYDNYIVLNRSVGVYGSTTEGETIDDIDTSFNLFKIHIRYKAFDLVDAVKATNDGTENSLKPITTSVTDLGTSTNKWKSLNGINPGALSLPDVSVSVVVDTTDWVYDGLTANLIKFNNAVQTFSGWLYITAQNTSASDRIVVRYIGSDASNLTFIGGKFDGASSIFVACPIVAGVSTYVWSTKALNTIKIYKAQGNV